MAWCDENKCGERCPLVQPEKVVEIVKQVWWEWLGKELKQALGDQNINSCVTCLSGIPWVTFEPK